MKRTYWGGTVLAVAASTALLWKTQAVSAGVRAGLQTCAGIIIPSLFPFMILAGLLSVTKTGAVLSRGVSAFTRPLGLPENLGAVLLMSFIGGFPVGARMLSSMLDRREIDTETAERALCFCVNAGPSFLISAVGCGILKNKTAGLLLLAAQALSSLTVCAVVFRKHRCPRTSVQPSRCSKDAFVEAVRSASAGMIGICAFVTAFAAIAALLGAVGITAALSSLLARLFPAVGDAFFSAAITGVLEVTNGCIAAACLPVFQGFLLCAFLVSFSSMSIIFQVKSCFTADCGVRFKRFYLSRFAHGGLTTLYAALLWRLIPSAALAASVSTSAPIPEATPNMMVTSLCLVAMCSILIFSSPTCQNRPAARK